eukprot:4094840-Lingulodinium_polyedra.AAC.1
MAASICCKPPQRPWRTDPRGRAPFRLFALPLPGRTDSRLRARLDDAIAAQRRLRAAHTPLPQTVHP